MYALTKIGPTPPINRFYGVKEARRKNVETCIEIYFGGVVNQFAKMAGRSHSSIWRCLQRTQVPGQPRAFGEKLCFVFESALGLPTHSLSTNPDEFREWAVKVENLEAVGRKISPGVPIWLNGVLVNGR